MWNYKHIIFKVKSGRIKSYKHVIHIPVDNVGKFNEDFKVEIGEKSQYSLKY